MNQKMKKLSAVQFNSDIFNDVSGEFNDMEKMVDQMQNKAAFNRSEYDRLTGLIHSVNPGLRGPLVAERNKLL